MPVSPTNVGYDGDVVRPEIQAIMDRIDYLLSDPVWAKNNNQATPEDQLLGAKKFSFKFPGQLNETEEQTIEEGWEGTTPPWTTVTCENETTNRLDAQYQLSWTLNIEYVP